MAKTPQPPNATSFSERLRALRKARGYRTAKSFALALKIDQNTYTRYERGEVEPNIHLLERIWDLLNLPTNSLIAPGGTAQPVTGLSSNFATGFQEAPLNEPVLADASAAEERVMRARKARREASAWRLAQLLAKSSDQTSKLSIVRDTAEAYERLMASPFEAIGYYTSTAAFQALPSDEQDALADLLAAYANAAVDDALK